MSFAAIGVAIVVAGASYYTATEEAKAKEEEQAQAKEDARLRVIEENKKAYEVKKSEDFATTVGKGVGDIGEVDTTVDSVVNTTYSNNIKL